MLKSGSIDPGILPRQKANIFQFSNKSNIKMRIGGHLLQLNYCNTCYVVRPPRTSHCSICDNCVERFDHHCTYLGTCIGKRNFKYFYFLLLFLNISGIFQIGYNLYTLVLEIKNKEEKSNGIIFIILISGLILYNMLFIIIFIGRLLVIHTYLIIKNMTFYEYIKRKTNIYPQGLNPFKKNLLFNCKHLLFKNQNKSNLLYALKKIQDNKKQNKGNQIKKLKDSPLEYALNKKVKHFFHINYSQQKIQTNIHKSNKDNEHLLSINKTRHFKHIYSKKNKNRIPFIEIKHKKENDDTNSKRLFVKSFGKENEQKDITNYNDKEMMENSEEDKNKNIELQSSKNLLNNNKNN